MRLLSASPDVEDSAIGNPVTFLTDLAKPLRQLKANFLPKQASGTPSPDNILPITGWTGLDVWHGGKNLFDEANAVRYGKFISFVSLTESSWRASPDSTSYTIKVKGNTKYTIKANNGNITIFRLGILLTDPADAPSNIDLDYAYNTNDEKTFTITTPSVDECWLILQYNKTIADARTGEIQVEAGETATSYEPYTGETLPVTWQTHGTIYGGYVDLVTGEVWETYAYYETTGEEDWLRSSSNVENTHRYSFELSTADVSYYTAPMCDKFKGQNYYNPSLYGITIATNKRVVVTMPDTIEDAEQMAEWVESVGGFCFAWELATPVLITTLTPQQINAIKGNNTIWSDANGNCEVTFLKKG